MPDYERFVVTSGQTLTLLWAGFYNPEFYDGCGGAGDVGSGGTLAGSNVIFDCNRVSHYGGAIYNGYNGTISLTGVNFNNNGADQGGAIYNNGAITLTEGSFNYNGANQGGAIYNDVWITLTDITFSNNGADQGGAIYSSNSITLTDVTFSGNSASDGGAIYNCYNGAIFLTGVTFSGNSANKGGAIYNDGYYFDAITLTDVTFSGNSAYHGGAIYNNGTMIPLTNVTFSGNSASDGGAIYNGGTITLTGLTFSGNTAYNGGAIYNGGTITLTGTTFSNNSAHNGGAIYNDSTITLTGATFSGNGADQGGAIYNGGTITLTGTTFSNNSAHNGGAMFNNGTIMLTDVTFSGNSAVWGGAIDNGGTITLTDVTFSGNQGGAINNYAGTITLTNVTFSDNQSGAIHNVGAITLTDVTFSGNSADWGGAIANCGTVTLAGTVTLQTANETIYNDNGATLNWDISGDSAGYLNDYSLLENYGTLSITVDADQMMGNYTLAGNAASAEGQTFTLTGVSGQSDISLTVNGDSKSYNGVTYTLKLMDDSLELNAFQRFVVASGQTVTLPAGTYANPDYYSDYGGAGENYGTLIGENVTFSGNTASSGGAIYNFGSITLTDATFSSDTAIWNGGAIYNNTGTITLTDVIFNGNTAGYGGAIYNDNGTMMLADATFSDNAVVLQGGTPSGGAIYNSGTITLNNVNFCDNNSEGSGLGSAIYNNGMVALTNGTFSDNAAPYYGGAICNDGNIYGGGTITLTDVTFSGNTAVMEGGAIYNNGAITLTGATFCDNIVPDSYGAGGAICNDWCDFAVITLTDVTFIGNTAHFGGAIGNNGAMYSGGTITLTGATFCDNFTFDFGSGGAIDNGGAAVLSDVIFTGNTSTDYGGAISNSGMASLTDVIFSENEAIQGGAIFNSGTITLTDATFNGNVTTFLYTDNGGAICNDGTIVLTSTTFTGNMADNGGAICNGYSNSTATITLTDVTFSGNSASQYGGAIYNGGTLTLADVTFSGNIGWGGSGAIYNPGIVNLTGAVTLATFSDAWVNHNGTTNWDLTNTTAGNSVCLNGFQNFSNGGYAKQTITVNASQSTGDYVIATDIGTDLTGKNVFTLTGITGIDDVTLTVGGEAVNYGDLSYQLVVWNNDLVLNVADEEKTLQYTLSASYSGIYDGTAHGVSVTVTDPAIGATVYYSIDGQQTWQTGSSYALIDVGNAEVYFKIEAEDYQTVITDSRSLEIAKRNVTLTSDETSKTYDGKALDGKVTVSGDGFVEGEATVSASSLTDVGNVINEITITGGTSYKESNYVITKEEGTLTVNKRNVTLVSASDSKEYDGMPLINDTITVGGDGFADGEGASYNVTGSQTAVGSSANTFEYALNDNTKAGNYNITATAGTLTVTSSVDCIFYSSQWAAEENVTVTWNDVVYTGKVGDGKFFNDYDAAKTSSTASGDALVVMESGTITKSTSYGAQDVTLSSADVFYKRMVLGGNLQAGNHLDFAGSYTMTVENGTFASDFAGGDAANGYVLRTGDVTVNVSGGSFAKSFAAGNYYATTGSVLGVAAVDGDLTLTISGGSFAGRVYGGNGAMTDQLGNCTALQGNTYLTIDASTNAINFGECVVAGSRGHGIINGSVNVTVTGNGANLAFADTSVLFGGCSGDYYTVAGNVRTASTSVTGDRKLVFDAFTGDFNAEIRMFSDVTLENNTDVNFADAKLDLKEVENWNFDCSSCATNLNKNKFSGDTIRVDTDGLTASWTLLSGDASAFADLASAASVTFGDSTATWSGSAWSDGTYTLAVQDQTKLVISKLA